MTPISIRSESSEDLQLFLYLFKLRQFKISVLFPWNISNCEHSKDSKGRERKRGQQIASWRLCEEGSVKTECPPPSYGNRLPVLISHNESGKMHELCLCSGSSNLLLTYGSNSWKWGCTSEPQNCCQVAKSSMQDRRPN